MFPNLDLRFKLLYRASSQGFTGRAFHSNCNNKGNTLVIIKATTGFIFGGYTNIKWANPEDSHTHITGNG